jgi:sigma-E factor negative regulatory protein RseC
MPTEEGVVFKMGMAGAGTAWVKTARSSACESCSSRHACQADGGGKEMEVEAINTADARVGDRIVLNIDTGPLLKATFLLYVFPVLALIAGAFSGQVVAGMSGMDPSGMSALFGFLFFGLAVVVIRIMGRRLSANRQYKPEIIKVRRRALAAVDAPSIDQATV